MGLRRTWVICITSFLILSGCGLGLRSVHPAKSVTEAVVQDIPSLALWLRADSLSATTTDGTAIATWPDSSASKPNSSHPGVGYDATQGNAAKQPVFKQGVLNGHPVLDFNGPAAGYTGTRYLSLTGAGLDILKSVPGLTIFVVWRTKGRYDPSTCPATTTCSENAAIFISRNAAAASGRFRFAREKGVSSVYRHMAISGRRVDGDPYTLAAGAADFTIGQRAFNDDEWGVDTGVVDYHNGLASIYRNGQLLNASSGGFTTGDTDSLPSMVVSIGAYNDSNHIRGQIAEMILFQKTLNDSERSAVEQYLGAKYGITVQ